MNHGSLFSGIGGFDLAAEWMGWENKFHCDINPFSRKLCSFYWPEAQSYDNIKTTDFRIWRGKIDVLSGGFPCQPFSNAGKRMGKEDERHLWPEMLRAIREIKPRYVVGENVRGIASWSDGLVFEEVFADLEGEGYEVQAFLLPAVGINAPHKRDRFYFVAKDTGSDGCIQRESEQEGAAVRELRDISTGGSDRVHLQERTATDSERSGLEHGNKTRNVFGSVSETQGEQCESPDDTKTDDYVCTEQGGPSEAWDWFPIESPICKGDDGISERLVNFVVDELYNKISSTSEENRIENLQEVWNRVSQKEIWEKIRRFYSLESEVVLLQTMQLYSKAHRRQEFVSPFGQELCQPILQHLQKHGEFRRSPQGQQLEKQRAQEFGDSLSFLPHEVALAAKEFEKNIKRFFVWHRKQSIMGYGNAIVPQIAYRIFATIHETESR